MTADITVDSDSGVYDMQRKASAVLFRILMILYTVLLASMLTLAAFRMQNFGKNADPAAGQASFTEEETPKVAADKTAEGKEIVYFNDIGKEQILDKSVAYGIASSEDFEIFAWYFVSGCMDTYGASYDFDFILTEDIVVDKNPLWENDRTFSGRFNGTGHTITFRQPYVITQSALDPRVSYLNAIGGLFGHVWRGNAAYVCSITNLGLYADIRILADHYSPDVQMAVGGIVGYSMDALISGCFFSGTIKCEGDFPQDVYKEFCIGGICGRAGTYGNPKISNCFTTGEIVTKSAHAVGGIAVGESVNLTDCYSTVHIETTNGTASGICGGWDEPDASTRTTNLSRCFFAGTIGGTGGSRFGITDRLQFSDLSGCYYLDSYGGSTEGQADAIAKTRAEMHNKQTYSEFTFSDTAEAGSWGMRSGDSYGSYYPELNLFKQSNHAAFRKESQAASLDVQTVYKVLFNEYDLKDAKVIGHDGTMLAYPQDVSYSGVRDVRLASPYVKGKVFKGWYVDGIYSEGDYTIPSGTKKDVRLTPKFELISYTLTLDPAGGSYKGSFQNSVISYNVNAMIDMSQPQKTGYAFVGWYETDEDETFQLSTFYGTRCENVTFHAKWTPAIYAITYDTADSEVVYPATAPTGFSLQQDAVVPVPKKAGYALTGWKVFSSASGVTEWVPCTGELTLKADAYYSGVKLTPVWKTTDYTLTLKLNGGSYLGSGIDPILKYTKNSSNIALLNPMKKGYDFEGWYESDPSTAAKLDVFDVGRCENVVLHAKWTPTAYRISYDRSDPEVTYHSDCPTEFDVQNDAVVPLPQKAGYALSGWSVIYTGGGKTISCTEAVTLKAENYYCDVQLVPMWEMIMYSVGYDTAGGSLGGQTPKYSYTVSDIFYINQIPAYEGYEFAGWVRLAEDGQTELGTPEKSIFIDRGTTGNLQFRAKWNPVQITLSFTGDYFYQGKDYREAVKQAMGGSFTYAYQQPLPTGSVTITLPVPEMANKTFKGWKINGRRLEELGAYTFTTGSYSVSAVTFEAVFEYAVYTITYDLNCVGQAEHNNPRSYDYDTPTFYLTPPVRANYTFEGWITGTRQEGGTVAWDEASKTLSPAVERNSSGNLYFQAVWKVISYQIDWENLSEDEIASLGLPTSYTAEDAAAVYTVKGMRYGGYRYLSYASVQMGSQQQSYETLSLPFLKSGIGCDLVILVAKSPIEYSVMLDANGGTVSSVQILYTVESVVQLPLPVYTGYTFLGWQENGTGEIVKDVVISGRFGSLQFIARWEAMQGDIKYVLVEDGSTQGIINSNSNSYSSVSDTKLSQPQRVGYAFIGWTCEQLSITVPQPTFVIRKGTEGELTLVAHWEIAQYTIGYILLGGNFDEGAEYPTRYDVIHMTEFVLSSAVSKQGYDFAGWYLKGTDGTQVLGSLTVTNLVPGGYTFCAKWKEHAYSITFDLGEDGTLAEMPETFTVSQMISVGIPKRAGYTFIGWTGTGIFNQNKLISLVINSGKNTYQDVAYVANWEIVEYNISYILGGGSFSSQSNVRKTFNITDSVTQFPVPTRLGYVFSHWYSLDGEGNAQRIDAILPKTLSASVTLYADWGQPVVWKIDYRNLAGCEPFGGVSAYTVETGFSLTEIPVKRGYIFKGWSYGKESGVVSVSYAAGAIAQNLELTAEWELQNYAVYYNLGDRGMQTGTPVTEYNVLTESIRLSTPVRSGYTFRRWTPNLSDVSVNGTGEGRYAVSVNEIKQLQNIFFTAEWEATVYRIDYEGIDQSIIEDPENGFVKSYTVESGETVIPKVFRKGYDFLGWSIGGENVGLTVRISKGKYQENLNFHANWKALEYGITYLLSGGAFSAADFYRSSYTIETNDFTLPAPIKRGYDFAGWKESGSDELKNQVTVTKGTIGALAFTAEFRLHSYTITYRDSSFDAQIQNPETYTIETPTFTLQNPSRFGYLFAGWTGSDLSSPDKAVIITMGEKAKDLSYTANWEAISYFIVYKAGGGVVSGNPSSYTIEDTFTVKNPTWTGYTFLGWKVGASDEVLPEYVIQNSTGDIILTAVWQKNLESIAFRDEFSGNLLAEVTVENGFRLGTELGAERVDVSLLSANTVYTLGGVKNIKYVYSLTIRYDGAAVQAIAYAQSRRAAMTAVSGTAPVMKISLYGAEKGYRVVGINDKGNVVGLNATTQGEYFGFTTDTLLLFAIVKSNEPLSPAILWGVIGGAIGVVLIIAIAILIRFTVFRKYQVTFVGADIQPYRQRKGTFLLMPTGYFWFDDPEMTRPFSYIKMPAHHLKAYTYGAQPIGLPQRNYSALPAGTALPRIEGGTQTYLNAGYAGYLPSGQGEAESSMNGNDASPQGWQNGGFGFDPNGRKS